MPNESRLSITIDSRSAEQQAKDLEAALGALDAAGIRVVNTTDKAGKSTSTAGAAFSRAGKDAHSGAGGVDDLNRSLAKTDDQAAKTAATLRRVLLAAMAGFSAMSLIDTADQWGQYASRIRMATESAEEYDHVQKRMAQSANETFRSIQETRESFIQMSPVLREMGLTLDQSIDAIDTFSGLLVVNAANSERGAAATMALAKSMQKGKIDAEAWMTIYSTLDSVIDVIAESSGMAGQEIRKLGAEGKLSVDVLVKALVEGNAKVMQQVKDMPTTVRDSMQNIGNAFSEYIGLANEANGVTAAMTGGLNLVGDNFEMVANVIGIAAAGALTIYTSRLIGSTVATVADMIARRSHAAAVLQEAQAQAAQTAATLTQVQALAGLGGSHVRVMAATKAHEVALKQLTVAQAAYSRIGSGLLAVLGGPVGLVATAGLAAASFLAFRYESDKSSVSADTLAQKIDALNTSTKELTKNQAAQAMLDLQPRLEEAQAQVKLLEDNIEGLTQEMKRIPPGTPLFVQFEEALIRAKGDLDTASGAVDRLTSRMNDLKGVASEVGQTMAGAAATASEEFLKAEARINKQIALMGKSGQAAQYRYELEHGELSKLTDAEKAKLKVGIDALDASEKAEEARRKSIKSTNAETKEIDGLLKTLREQVSVLGMTEAQAARYRIETAKGTDAQRQEALALFDKAQAHKAAEQATKLETDAMREQRNLAAEIGVFQRQQDLEISGMGMGDRRRAQLEQELSIQEEFANRRRELDEAQLTESTRMSAEAYQRQVDYLKEAEEQKIGIVRDSAERRMAEEQNWVTGVSRALENYVDKARNVSGQVDSALTSTLDSLTDAGAKWAAGMEVSITDVGRSFAAMIIKMQMQAAAAPLFNGIQNAISGFFAPAAAPAGVTPGVDWTFPGRASGGPVSAGKMYEVNERGDPELLNVGKRQFLMMGPDSGQVTPTGGSSSSASPAAPNVQVNVINKGEPMQAAQQGSPRFDGAKWVIDVVLDKARRSNAFRTQLKGALA